jgi:hypothetical protein
MSAANPKQIRPAASLAFLDASLSMFACSTRTTQTRPSSSEFDATDTDYPGPSIDGPYTGQIAARNGRVAEQTCNCDRLESGAAPIRGQASESSEILFRLRERGHDRRDRERFFADGRAAARRTGESPTGFSSMLEATDNKQKILSEAPLRESRSAKDGHACFVKFLFSADSAESRPRDCIATPR